MMKTIATILIFVLTTTLAVANEIDNLKTTKDVQKFLTERVNEKTKRIEDYGQRGTFGLMNLYGQLFDLRSTQKWE